LRIAQPPSPSHGANRLLLLILRQYAPDWNQSEGYCPCFGTGRNSRGWIRDDQFGACATQIEAHRRPRELAPVMKQTADLTRSAAKNVKRALCKTRPKSGQIAAA
jgi:hypothetical protein